jgi:predicted  nucleic acid-binding Zn-ribbon protein
MNSDKELEQLEHRVAKLEENLNFLKDLLTHIKGQFEKYRKEIDNKR